MSTENTKSVRAMTNAEFRQACAELDRRPLRGVDWEAINQITQGRRATDLSDIEWRQAQRIMRQESRR